MGPSSPPPPSRSLFLNIVLLLHTKETELVKLVVLAYMTIRPSPSHDFYNKYTAALSDGSVFRSLGFFYFANSHKVLSGSVAMRRTVNY